MAALFLIMTLLGCVLLYLSHPNQRWLARPLPVIGGRWSGLVLVITGLLVAISYLPVNAALFAWLVMMMLVIGLLPFAFLLKPDAGDHTGGR
ncbi:MAG: hypothetical protein CMI08_13455 [Oceanospirillaceae bacterium]|uniref:hypothetical protein n=1 Tax=unclassified Thalassolituus TaxID=2624967 RepID=UPI000C621C75|nr:MULTISPECIES: hypothetical protein [unclassified Thalassolituus]MAS26022.1 hypothetical protein [Oceanospirillaceae bacterium]MAY00179.1 hypothetical protein [Oceanospirillaceae bacterium]MBL33947.1 hypothetical protein [Oceanospirillaceae bacterium]MBS52927.1 hypothetical protein [Oceanospirillaceae bacterium]MBS54252.1 hypothetical protein [Oceanospirillaceae bacterium]|tara:strand:- start:135 stop:410 length:276 start_codon:yes stop_codon:yes gene_type:complete